MNILVIPSWYPPNGGMFFAHQTRWLMDEGISAGIIVVEEKSLKKMRISSLVNDLSISRGDEYGIYTYRKTQFRVPRLNRLNAMLWIRSAVNLTERYILENAKPDIMQVHSCMWGGVVAAKIKKNHGIPYVITEHRGRFNQNDFFKNKDILPWHYPFLKEALANADAIIPVSGRLVAKLNELAEKKLSCSPYPNPVDDGFFEPSDHELIKQQTDFLNISNFLPYKAIDVLIHAFSLASSKMSDMRLHLVGDGPGRLEMEALVKRLDLSESVFLYGMKGRQEVKSIIQACDFLVLSSFNEGQPVVIGEATLCGKPVICTDVVSNQDVPDFAGLIVETGNPKELADAMLFAHTHKKSFDAGRIRDFALSRFSRKVVIAEVIQVMKSVVHTDVSI